MISFLMRCSNQPILKVPVLIGEYCQISFSVSYLSRKSPLSCPALRFSYSKIDFFFNASIVIIFEEQYRCLKRAKQQGTEIIFNECLLWAGFFIHVTLCDLHNNL